MPWTGFARCESRLTARCSSIALAEALRIEITVLETELALLDDRDAAVDEIMPLAEAWDRRPSPLRRCLGHRA